MTLPIPEFDPTQFNTGANSQAVKADVPTISPPTDIAEVQTSGYQGYEATTPDAQSAQNYQGYDVTTATNTGSGDYNPYSAQTVDPNVGTYDALTGSVSNPSLVENRISGLLSRDSDYMRRAETFANQQSNRRGLLNSSMAVGAAHGAAIDAALPIAQQDAQAFANMEMANLQYQNQARQLSAEAQRINAQFNAGQLNQAERDNALADIENRQFNAELEHQTKIANMAAQNEAARTGAIQTQQGEQFNAELAQQAEIEGARLDTQAAETNALAAQAEGQFNTNLLQQANMFNAEQDLTAALANYEALVNAEAAFADAKNNETFAALSAQLNGWLAELDAGLQSELQELEHQYSLAENADSVNGAIYQELVNSISFIMANTADVDEAKSKVSLMLEAAGAELAYTSVEGLIGLDLDAAGLVPDRDIEDMGTIPEGTGGIKEPDTTDQTREDVRVPDEPSGTPPTATTPPETAAPEPGTYDHYVTVANQYDNYSEYLRSFQMA